MVLLVALTGFGLIHLAYSQGMATGSATAQPARPLPEGMKLPTVNFVDVADKAGLTGVNISGRERGKKYILETTGTGIAIFDYDNDGFEDILLVNAGRLDAPDSKLTHYLYRNLGGLRFRDVTAKAGILHTGWAQGVCAGDI
ncbi:MAG: FG-GAP repeat domain-containing protein, partial [Bryobacteraceae bacterium]